MINQHNNKTHIALFLFILAFSCLAVYYQGLRGPFIFDDHGNIQENASIRLTQLSTENLKQSALSGRAGPLKRPVAMLSFALNYYFAGGYYYLAFKLTNVIIQAFCAFALFYLSLQLLNLPVVNQSTKLANSNKPLIAFSIALLWTIHPINLTSVLYVVQRMTSLSTLFSLIALIYYIKARTINASFKPLINSIPYFLISALSFLLAIFSKENALLTPVYLLLIEWVFFSQHLPWINFKNLPATTRKLIWSVLLMTSTALLLFLLNYAANGYTSRTFTLVERVLTEGRVICFYLSLIVLPRINGFGLFHDDIALSTSLFEPWTTIVSLLFILTLITYAIHNKKRKPLVAFGILFFFAGHLLESTIFGLEIAHEHRNHLPSIGIILALAGLFLHHQPFKKNTYIVSAGLFFIVLSATTVLRASQWQNDYSLATYEAAHHPNSPATLALLSSTAYKHKKYEIAEKAINNARILEPNESSYAINSLVLQVLLKKPTDHSLTEEIKTKLKQNPFTASTQIAFTHISTRLRLKEFKPLRHQYIEWLNIVLNKLGDTRQASIYHYFLAKAYLTTGNTLGAINAHQQAFNLDKKFINPLFEMGNIFLALKQVDGAKIVLEQIIQANKNPDLVRHYDTHIDELRDAIAEIEREKVVN